VLSWHTRRASTLLDIAEEVVEKLGSAISPRIEKRGDHNSLGRPMGAPETAARTARARDRVMGADILDARA
jgi:hypothetical protein